VDRSWAILNGVTSRFRRTAAVVAITAGLASALVGCGRAAPEGAAGPVGADDGTEPAAAGVQVASEQTIVPPSPTTLAPQTTTSTVATTLATAGSYVVQPGDTLSVIAQRFNVSIAALSEANGITDVNTIRPGQELNIPASAPAG
jgi:LysM repeat protein